jgi:hypothetical protein
MKKKIIFASVIVIVLALVLIIIITIKTDPYFVHVFSKESGEAFYKETQVADSGNNTYVNDKYGVSIWYPDLYVVNENVSSDSEEFLTIAEIKMSKQLYNDKFLDGILISYRDLSQDKIKTDVEQFFKLEQEKYSNQPGYNASIVDSGDISLNNVDGKYFVVKINKDNTYFITIKEVYSIKDNKLFNISFYDSESEFPISVQLGDKMLKSFTIN